MTINEIKPYELNAKVHSEKQLEKLAKIVQKVGWRQPILVSAKTKSIIVGHGRWLCWNKYKDIFGLKEIWAMTDTGENISGQAETKAMTPEEEKMYRFADNAVSQLGEVDLEVAKLDLRDLSVDFLDLACFDQSLFADADYSKKNKEIEPSSIKRDTTLVVPFQDYTVYLQVLELLNGFRGDSEESDGEIIYRALSNLEC